MERGAETSYGEMRREKPVGVGSRGGRKQSQRLVRGEANQKERGKPAVREGREEKLEP